jgi:hypothetical protein
MLRVRWPCSLSLHTGSIRRRRTQRQRWCAFSPNQQTARPHATRAAHDNQALQLQYAPARHLTVARALVAAALRALGCNRPSRHTQREAGRGSRLSIGPPSPLPIAKRGGGGLLVLVRCSPSLLYPCADHVIDSPRHAGGGGGEPGC